MTDMKYTWIKGEPCIIAVVYDDEHETTEPFNIPELQNVIEEMKELKRIRDLRVEKGAC